MKLNAVLAAVAPFLATDKKSDEVKKAILTADKAAKDAAGSEESVAKDKAAKDRKAAHDKARDKMNAEDKAAFDAMSDEEKDKVAKDGNDDPEGTNDAEPDVEDEELKGDPSTPSKGGKSEKPALDSAEVDRRIAAAVGARDAIHTALREVEPILGVVAFDSAGDAYRAALAHLKVDVKGIHESALPAMLRLAKTQAQTAAPVQAMDSASIAEIQKLIPNYNRL